MVKGLTWEAACPRRGDLPTLLLILVGLIGWGLAIAAPVSDAEGRDPDEYVDNNWPADSAMTERPSWAIEGRDWPNRDLSRFVEAGGIRWHTQQAGQGPALLLLHGTGASTHSWQALIRPLAEHFTVIAPDLPGHGLTTAPPEPQFSLPGMAELVAELLMALDQSPALVVGHSAGAAILARMILDGQIAPRTLISLNGALLGRGGLGFRLFAPLVRVIVTTDLAARAFAWRASDRDVVAKTLAGTGSELPPEQLDWYARLFAFPGHTGATLMMMAKWHLETLERDLPRLDCPTVLVAATEDGFVQPSEADQVQVLLPQGRVERLSGLGHLAHEERPELVVELILGEARARGLIPGAASQSSDLQAHRAGNGPSAEAMPAR